MSKIKKMNFIYLILSCVVISVVAFVGFYSYVDRQLSYPIDEGIKLEDEVISEDEMILEPHVNDNASIEVATKLEDKVTASTKMVYRYCYEENGKVVEKQVEPDYKLINKNRQQVEAYYPNWQLVSFSNKEIVLSKSISAPSNTDNFIIGAYDDYICVYYGDGTLRELTQTNISSLPEEEQKLIESGIKIESEEELLRYLQDYTS